MKHETFSVRCYSIFLRRIKKLSGCARWKHTVMNLLISILFLGSEYLIARSGYSNIMDLSVLNKNAILIPTPGQTEQEYLAKYHSKLSNIIWTNQTDFKLNGNNDFGKINSFTNEKLLRTEITKIGL